jgi:hypothetical protein
LRLTARDGPREPVAATPANANAFGRRKGPRGPSASPLLQWIYLEECGTHAVVGTILRPCPASEPGAGRVLLKQVGPDALLPLDSAPCCSPTLAPAQARGVQVLTRAKARLPRKPFQLLADGTDLARMDPRNPPALRGKRAELAPLRVRVIRSDAPDPQDPERRIVHRLATTLRDPAL